MFDVITFGSSTSDTFLRLPKGTSLVFGSKILVTNLKVFSGGGGTNTACTFSNQGFKVAYVGKVGEDRAGEVVFEDLKRFKVATKFLQKDKNRKTAASVILSPVGSDRTILIYQGACHFSEKKEIPWQKIKKAKWFYIAPLYKKSSRLLEPLVKFAKERKIKVAVNPSKFQLKMGWEKLKPVFSQIDILFLNEEEAKLLGGAERIVPNVEGIVVVTKGKRGSVVYQGKNVFEAGIVPVKVVEKTGAGDAYGSGFLAGLLRKDSIEYAIQLATANAAGCIQKPGAKNGLLKKADLSNLPKVEIIKRQITN